MAVPRQTTQRQAILAAVKASARFLTAEEVFRQVKRRCRGIGLSTVYRNLDALARRGEVFTFEDGDGIRKYAGFAFHDSAFTCESCGRRVDVPLRRFEALLSGALPDTTLFFSRLDVRGLCRRCTRERARMIRRRT